MADRVEGAEILYVEVSHARFIDEGYVSRRDQLIVLGRHDGDFVAFLNDGAFRQSHDRISSGAEIITRITAHGIQNFADQLAREIAADVRQVIEATKVRSICRRSDGDNRIDDACHAFELRHIQRLKCAFRVSHEVDPCGARFLVNFFDERGQLCSGLADRLQATDVWKRIVGAIRNGKRAEIVLLQICLQEVQVLIVRRAQAVEENHRVRVRGAAAAKIVVRRRCSVVDGHWVCNCEGGQQKIDNQEV